MTQLLIGEWIVQSAHLPTIFTILTDPVRLDGGRASGDQRTDLLRLMPDALLPIYGTLVSARPEEPAGPLSAGSLRSPTPPAANSYTYSTLAVHTQAIQARIGLDPERP
jgi:hypothetical protein